MGLLEELYLGNITFSEGDIQENEDYQTWSEKMRELNKKLSSILTQEQQELFNNYSNAFVSASAIAETEQFMFGFKTGAILMIEILTGADVYLP